MNSFLLWFWIYVQKYWDSGVFKTVVRAKDIRSIPLSLLQNIFLNEIFIKQLKYNGVSHSVKCITGEEVL